MRNLNDLGQGQGHSFQGQILKYGPKWLLSLVSIALVIRNIIISVTYAAQMMMRCPRDNFYLKFARNGCGFHGNRYLFQCLT